MPDRSRVCLTNPFNCVPRDRLPGPITWKQPLFRVGPLPILPQNVQQSGREHHVAVLAPLALLHSYDHALAVDRRGPQVHSLGDTQPGCIADGQDHSMLHVTDRAQELSDLLLAQHVGKFLRSPTGRDVLLAVQARLSVTV